MSTNKQNLEETRKLNQKSQQGSMINAADTATFEDMDLQEAKQLNQQSKSKSSSGNLSSSTVDSSLQETKQLNQKSRQQK